MREGEERDLPSDSTRMIRVVMKFIDDDVVHGRVFSVAQREVREDFRGAADDRSGWIHGGVSGHQADILWPESLAQ